MTKPKVTINPVANQYAGPDERIIEYSSTAGGGLIAFRVVREQLLVQPYNHDSTVLVTASGIVREAALAFLHGDDSQAISLKSLADALGVPYEDVEAIQAEDREMAALDHPHPEHTECADGCGLDINHDGACRDHPGGRIVCEHVYEVISDRHSNHNLPIGAQVAWLEHKDGVDHYTQGGDGDEVAIDPQDLSEPGGLNA